MIPVEPISCTVDHSRKSTKERGGKPHVLRFQARHAVASTTWVGLCGIRDAYQKTMFKVQHHHTWRQNGSLAQLDI